MKLPPVDPSLVEHLERKWPNSVPDLDASDREVWAAVGRQEVIRYLRALTLKIAKENLKE